jgi:RNA polymerase sigma-70 factor, ECF subfamily
MGPDASSAAEMDRESQEWLAGLRAQGILREEAQTRLYKLLLRVAHSEANRRRPLLPPHTAADLDDLCFQATDDALFAIINKLDAFRGRSRFTTWASKFVILELSTRLRRSAWRDRRVEWSEATWDGVSDSQPTAEQRVLLQERQDSVLLIVKRDLTELQRKIVLAVIVHEVPIDVLAERLGSTRGAIYKNLYDARLKLRDGLARQGGLESAT